MLLKNRAGQKWRVFAFNRTTNAPVTLDAANITAKIDLDHSGRAALADVNPVETEDGFYLFDLAASETNGDQTADLYPESTSPNVQVIGVPGTQSIEDPTEEPNDNELADIETLARTPKRTRTDEGTVEERPIEDVIAAERYEASKAVSGPPYGVTFARIRPPGTT